MSKQSTWIIWLVSISISSEFEFFSIEEAWDLAHGMDAGGEHSILYKHRKK